jgi:hypothetical protein
LKIKKKKIKQLKFRLIKMVAPKNPGPPPPPPFASVTQSNYKTFFIFRLEMYTKAVSSLHASEGSTFVYAWWFNLLSTPIVAAKTFWHIFQVSCVPPISLVQ